MFSLVDFPDRPAHFVRGGLFEQKAHRAGLGRMFDIRVIAVRGKHEHFGGGDGFENLPRGFQTIEQRHRDVHHHHVGTKFFGQRDGLAAVLRFADNFNVVFEFEHLAKTFAHNRMVFSQQNSDVFHNNFKFGSSGLRSADFSHRGGLSSGISARNGGAFAGCGFHNEVAADHLHAFPHAEQAQTFAALGVQGPFHSKDLPSSLISMQMRPAVSGCSPPPGWPAHGGRHW